jgi:Big-like domain-containing protein
MRVPVVSGLSGWGRRVLVAVAVTVATVVAGPLMPGARAAADGGGSVVTPPASFADLAIASDCSSDATQPMQAWLAQLPAGITVDLAGGCYQIDHGLIFKFVNGITIEDGTFQDLNNTPGQNKGHGTPRGVPVLDFLGGSDVAVTNVTFVGVDHGGYHAHLAFQSAVELQGTIGASLSAVAISKTFGDGIDLEPLRGGSDHRSGGIVNPSENISIFDVVIRGSGRQGITLASVNGATITDVTMSNVAMDAFDFEADQVGEGARNVVINGCSFSQLLNISMQGPQTGPITVENCVMPEADQGWAVNIKNTTGRADAGPIVFDNDVFNCGASVYVACFDLNGATDLTVENSVATIGYLRDRIHEHAYRAVDNTRASFVNDNVSGYGILGGVSSNSSVSLVGGKWSPIHSGPTTTTLNQSSRAVAYGSEGSDTFAVTVTGGKGPAPSGTVTVADLSSQSPICVAALVPVTANVSTGSCTATTDEFSGGTAFTTVAATYYGDGNYSDSQTPLQTFTVGAAPTSTSLTENVDDVDYGSENAVVFVATVTEEGGGGPPSGSLTVEDAATSTAICTAVLVPDPGNDATAICGPSEVQFPSGTSFSSIVATYDGDGNDAPSVSPSPLDLVVGSGGTIADLTQSGPTVEYGTESSDTFVTTVTSADGLAVPTGSVTVEDTATMTLLCGATLVPSNGNSSTATCSPTDTQFPVGTALGTVTAFYGGDADNDSSSSSPAQVFTVGPAASSTALSESSETVDYGSESADTFSVTVAGSVLGLAPSGTVTVADLDSLSPICTAPLVANPDDSSTGTCSPADTEFPPGTSFGSVTASYSGDGVFGPSSSSPLLSLTVTNPGFGGVDGRSGPISAQEPSSGTSAPLWTSKMKAPTSRSEGRRGQALITAMSSCMAAC